MCRFAKAMLFSIGCMVLLASLTATVSAAPPGAPLAGTGFTITIKEKPEPAPPGTEPSVSGPYALPTTVEQGFVVLVESTTLPATDPHNWSDVVDFRTHQALQQAFLVSDPSEQGITDADLAPLGLSINAVLTGNTLYVPEQSPTNYSAQIPGGPTARYVIFSDLVTPTLHPFNVTWLTTTAGAVRFHLRFTNDDPESPSEAINGQIMSQSFGVFLSDFGSIGAFSVPAMQPNSFFDVFTDVPLSQLPPSALEITPGMAPASAGRVRTQAGCPPDDHWDGNVDITWTGASGSTGQVTKHIGTVQVCPAHGNSYIHTMTSCGDPSGSSWTIAGLCPGWSATLVNEGPPLVPAGPAPNPVPPGWTGFICISANASVLPGATCPMTVTFNCAGAPGVIDLEPVACQCGPLLPPGTPGTGTDFTVFMREKPDLASAGESVFGPFALPVVVEQGFVVLVEDSLGPRDDPHNWSDVVDFRSHQAAKQAYLVSDPLEQGITDADLAPLGLTINDVLTGNTVYVPERRPTVYTAQVAGGPVGRYVILSDVSFATLAPNDVDWVTTPTGSVRFHLRFRNDDPEAESEALTGQIDSQSFGVFQPNFGPIGTFNVPALVPSSFFDVFTEISLDQLPPSAREFIPGTSPMARKGGATVNVGCPPDNHWDGNVDINWSSPSGGGHVNKHIGTLEVCPGHGNSYIHTLVFCGSAAGASWSISGLCPGWSATLVNEIAGVPDGPAPNPVPAGWTGFICISAGAVVLPGATCPFQVTFVCDGVPGVIDLQPFACDCAQLPPGTPIGGVGGIVDIRENPDEPPPGQAEPISGPFQLPGLVQQGFVVLVEQSGLPRDDPRNWSDVVDFKTHQTAKQAFMASDPREQGMSDADLAPLGLTVFDVLNGNTVYLLEEFPVTTYQATDPATGAVITYRIVSDTPGGTGVGAHEGVAFGIRGAAPNPARGSVQIDYGLSRSGPVRVEVFDLSGKLVRRLQNGASTAGPQSVRWDGTNQQGERVAAGAYFVMLKAEGKTAAHRIVMLH